MTMCVCMSMYMYACLFVREDISETRCSNFIEFSVHLRVAVARFSSGGIVLLCFLCFLCTDNDLCTYIAIHFRFSGQVTFAHRGKA